MQNELVGDECEAIELYPAESRLVDTANQYWLWCFPYRIPLGFSSRLVGEMTPDSKGKQRPWSPDDRPADCKTGEEMVALFAKAGVPLP